MAFTDPEPGPGTGPAVAGISLGCLFSALVLSPFLVVAGMAQCGQSGPGCSSGMAGWLLSRALLALGPAILLALTLRSLLHWLGARLRALRAGVETEAGVRTPWFALLGLPLSLCGGVLLVWAP